MANQPLNDGRLRHSRMRLEPAVLGVVGDPPGGHLLGRVGHQQLGWQRAGLDPSAGDSALLSVYAGHGWFNTLQWG